jgi:anti-anti-sigma factor
MMLHESAPPPVRGLRFSARTADVYIIAALSGELDVACTPVLREQLLSLLRPQASRLIVDLSEVSFCDASGLAVLVATERRARLLGGLLRVAAPAHAVVEALRISGMLRQFDIYPTVLAATAQLRTSSEALSGGPPATANTSAAAAPDSYDLREAVTAVLAHADAWRDADPNRRFTSPLRVLASAHVRDDHAALTEAARSLLAALTRYPLTYSPAVAATASNLQHLIGARSHLPALV